MRKIEESKVRRAQDKEMLEAWSRKEFPNLKSKPLHVSLERK
jgi:serine/threonine-protein kinase RIO1